MLYYAEKKGNSNWLYFLAIDHMSSVPYLYNHIGLTKWPMLLLFIATKGHYIPDGKISKISFFFPHTQTHIFVLILIFLHYGTLPQWWRLVSVKIGLFIHLSNVYLLKFPHYRQFSAKWNQFSKPGLLPSNAKTTRQKIAILTKLKTHHMISSQYINICKWLIKT